MDEVSYPALFSMCCVFICYVFYIRVCSVCFVFQMVLLLRSVYYASTVESRVDDNNNSTCTHVETVCR
jgi:hypothetical protein